jgi:hypothetical protein
MRNRESAGWGSRIRALAPFFAVGATLASGCGRGPEPPSAAAAIGTRAGWHIVLSEPRADTIRAAWDDVMPAAERTFEADDWRIVSTRDAAIVTAWKPIRHPLVTTFAGNVEARCAVTVRTLRRDRSLVTFQAGIASRKSIAHSPALGLAKGAYRKAAQNWMGKLRADLSRHNALKPAGG